MNTVTVEIEIDNAWLNVTRIDEFTRVLGSDDERKIAISRGRQDEQGRIASQNMQLDYLDMNAYLDGENYASPLYKKIGLGTLIQVRRGSDVRFIGEIAGLEPMWDDGLNNVVVTITAAGILTRLEGELNQPLKSVAYRTLSSPDNDANRVLYLPLEEDSGATAIYSHDSALQASFGGDISFGGDVSASSARLLQFGTNGQIFCSVPAYTSTEHKVCFLFRFPEAGLTDGAILFRMYCSGGNVAIIDLVYNTPWTLRINAYSGTALIDSGVVVDWTNWISENEECFMSMEFTQSGANLDVLHLIGNVVTGSVGLPTETLTGCTIGRIAFVTGAQSNCSGLSMGHLIVGNDTGSFPNYISPTATDALGWQGFAGEVAGRRLERLCTEAGLFLFPIGELDDTIPMGPQTTDALIEQMYQCPDVDGGLFFESRDFFDLTYVPRSYLYNQAPTASLNYSHVGRGFRPITDTQGVANDVTMNRDGGSEFQYKIPDDDVYHWTTQPPPEGANPRPFSATPNLETDDQLPAQAAWAAHISSWRDKRYPTFTVNTNRSAFSVDDRTAVQLTDLGRMIAVGTVGSPAWIPYDEVRLLVQGYREYLNQTVHIFEFNATSADAYEVEQVDAEGSELCNNITDSGTVLRVSPPTLGPAWTTDTDDTPFNMQVAGDPFKVDSIATESPLFIAAGTNAAGNNASVVPGLPAGIGGGGLMLCFAGIRNSGTGTVGTNPTGWRTLVDFANVRLMFKYFVGDGSDTAPTVTFLNGVANADTFARIFGFDGLSHVIGSSPGYLVDPAAVTSLNSSAANMAYSAFSLLPGRSGVSLIFAWKQDDWTSVAPPSGFTEMDDTAATTGDDIGHAAYYDLSGQTEAAGSLVVTGGASAISRTIALHLLPTQLLNVERGIEGTPVAHTIGSEIRGWRYGVNGL